ncbi:hypothetical protein BH23ACT5_BH23ACT5_02120 [soil metagenome]
MRRTRSIDHRLALAVAIAVMVVSLPALGELPPGGSFTDDDGSVHEADIEALAGSGITRGCNPPWNDAFCPERAVTRGEMAAFLTRALGLEAGPEHFVDVALSPFQAEIHALADAGITRGCNPPENDRFCPGRAVTRGEMAAFLVRAYGYPADSEDLFVDDDDSVFERDIDALASVGVTRGCNPPANDRFCPHAPVTRQEMASFLTRAEGLTPMLPPPRPGLTLGIVATGLARPTYATAPPGDERVFVAEKGGAIRIVRGGAVEGAPFLDISDRVTNRGEMGLLSIAFHPDYPDDGRVFVFYSQDDDGLRSRVSQFEVSGDADVLAVDETILLTISQPAANHNGGHLVFGPDGHLFIALGDGGGANDQFENAQNSQTLPGSLLRIDVDTPSGYAIPSDNPFVGGPGRDEIWGLGLRNPWRIWFDEDLLYVADVGQGHREEVTVVPAGKPLVNYGWPRFEGSRCNPDSTDPSCASAGFEFPDVEYSHGDGVCAVTGGIVYRGDAIHWLQGHYFYGDACGGWIRSFRTADGVRIDDPTDWQGQLQRVPALWSFGVDGDGEMLVMSGGNGTVYRLEAAD